MEPDAFRLALHGTPTRGGLPAFVPLPPADPNIVASRDDVAE